MPSPFRVYPEYLRLVEQLATVEGVSTDDQEELLSKVELLLPPIERPGNFSLMLKVDDPQYPFERNTVGGTIYELNGENLRNKTTTLIFIATLFGADWDELSAFLHDPKMVKQAKLVQSRLEQGIVNASLEAQDDRYRVEITIQNSEAGVLVYDKEEAKYLIPHQGFRLAGASDWHEFRKAVKSLADAQVIAAGRFFISQIGFEEAENLTSFCDVLWKDVIAELSLKLNSKKPKVPASVAAINLERETNRVKRLEQEIGAVAIALAEVLREASALETTVQEGNALWQNPVVVKAMRASLRAQSVRLWVAEENEYRERIERLRREAAGLELAATQVLTQSNTLDTLALELSSKLNGLRPSLPHLQDRIDDIQTLLKSSEVPIALRLMMEPTVDPASVQAHRILSSHSIWSGTGVSQSTPLLPTVVNGQTCSNVSEFREAMNTAQVVAEESLRVRELARPVVDQIKEMGLTLESSRSELEETHSLLSAGLKKHAVDLAGLQANLLKVSAKLDAEGTRNVTTLTDEAERLHAELDLSVRQSMQQLSYKGVDLGRWDTGERDRLVSGFADCKGQAQSLRDRSASTKRSLQEARAGVETWKKAVAEAAMGQDVERRINALGNLQSKVRAIKEYFSYSRAYLDSHLDSDRKHAEENRRTLGVFFSRVMTTLNDRIRARCPVAFVNHGDGRGVVPEKVVRVDFERDEFEVDNIPPTATLHGGLNSAMTILGLASRRSTTLLGSVLLVDEYRDVGVYRESIYRKLMELPHLRLGIFVRVLDEHHGVDFQAWRPS